jgi:hypothetical protein
MYAPSRQVREEEQGDFLSQQKVDNQKVKDCQKANKLSDKSFNLSFKTHYLERR